MIGHGPLDTARGTYPFARATNLSNDRSRPARRRSRRWSGC